MYLTDYAWYRAWRRIQAYAVPMTEEGKIRADIKAESFKDGFEAGLRYAATQLELEHAKVKKEHSFFYKASQFLRGLK